LNATLKPVAGWLFAKAERFGVGAFTAGALDGLTHLLQGKSNPVEMLCQSLAGGLSNMGPEGEALKAALWGGATGIVSCICPK
jgi:hypothetical protein